MLRIVIFDDEERIGLQLKELLEQSGDDLVVDFFQDWHALQFYFSQHAHIDAVFMDICFQRSTSSGIDFAEKIAQSHSQTKFIYVTGHPREYLQQIFMSKTVNPFGYLPKPFDRKAVQDYLQKIRAASADSQDLFPFKPKKGQVVYLSLPEVLYFSSDRRCVTAHTLHGSYEGYYQLSKLMESLPQYFYQCYKSYAINLHYVQRIDTKEVHIQEEIIPISAYGHRSVAENRAELVQRKSELYQS